MPTPFAGFPLGTLHFLDELAANNNRPWFEANKQRYETLVREPALAFIAAMEKPLRKVSPEFRAVAKKSGGSLMRVYRDVRFAKDKAPYKTNVGIHFRHSAGRDVHAPGLYVHIGVDECFLGAGVWRPDSPSLAAIRSAIDADPARWKRVRNGKRFRDAWDPAGESLRRPPRGYPADHPLIEDLKRKDHIAAAPLDQDDLLSGDLVPRVADAFTRAKAYVGWLCRALDLPV